MKAKMILGGAVLAASAVAGTAVAGPFSANIGVASNYIWRGVTQTNDQAAVSGGVDYSHDSGFYAGTWISNVDFSSIDNTTTPPSPVSGTNFEQDWYLGYGFTAGPVDLDVGYILYTYPVGDDKLDFGEVYVNASWQWLTAGIAYNTNKEDGDADTGDIYLYASGEFDVNGVGLGFVIGSYDIAGGSDSDYIHYGVSMSKSDFTLALDKNDMDGAVGDYRFSVSWSKSFDL